MKLVVALTLPSLSWRTLFKRNHHTTFVHTPLGVTDNIEYSIPTNPLTFSLLLLIDFHQAKWQWQEWKMSSQTAKLWELLHSLAQKPSWSLVMCSSSTWSFSSLYFAVLGYIQVIRNFSALFLVPFWALFLGQSFSPLKIWGRVYMPL